MNDGAALADDKQYVTLNYLDVLAINLASSCCLSHGAYIMLSENMPCTECGFPCTLASILNIA